MTQLVQRRDAADIAPKPPPTDDEQRQALLRLVGIVGAGIAISILTGTILTVLVIVALMAMIMLHEFGHYLLAKRSGMKVTEFFLGFGPRLWSFRRGETEYGVKAFVLLGGYVRIVGMTNLEEVPPEDEPRTYRAAPYRGRLATISAGPATHFVIAFVLLYVLNAFVGVIHNEDSGAQVREIIRFDRAVKSPAEEAGIKPGDVVLRVGSVEVDEPSTLTGYIKEHPGQPIPVDVLRDGRRLSLVVTPVDASDVRVQGKAPTTDHVGFVGVGVTLPSRVERANPIAAVGRAGGDVWRVTRLSVRGLADLVSFNGIKSYGDQLTGKAPEDADPADQPRLVSPVGLVRFASAAADSGLRAVLYLLVAINVFVGLLNLLPLLPFDGGHIAVATYERIRSRRGAQYRVDITKLLPVTYMVVMLLMFVAVTALYLDITQPLKL